MYIRLTFNLVLTVADSSFDKPIRQYRRLRFSISQSTDGSVTKIDEMVGDQFGYDADGGEGWASDQKNRSASLKMSE